MDTAMYLKGIWRERIIIPVMILMEYINFSMRNIQTPLLILQWK